MLLGLALFWVGADLCVNGVWQLGGIGDKESTVINVFVGTVTLCVALIWAFGPNATLATVKDAGLLLLFTFTYYWLAWNQWTKVDGRGLGWFCLFVAITTIPVFIAGFIGAHTVWNYWLSACWVLWGSLWFLFFLLLALKVRQVAKAAAIMLIFNGIFTGWIPGYLLFTGVLH